MNCYRLTLQPVTAFGSRPKGDMLFGQLCWAARNRHGEAQLSELLHGYTQGEPWAVISDALPDGYFPRPALPGHWYERLEDVDHKIAKKRAWLPIESFQKPVGAWLRDCQPAIELGGSLPDEHSQPHNTINRSTGTTGEGQFAPYAVTQHWYGAPPDRMKAGMPALNVYVVLDESRLSAGALRVLFEDMGQFGFGRDATIGLGKFTVQRFDACELPAQAGADAWVTLAPSVPQGQGFDASRSFYQVFTRFGRHGDMGVHFGNPFKTPVLMADTAAVYTPGPAFPGLRSGCCFIGKGLGGDGSLSKVISQTVHQGYAPVLGVRLPVPPDARADRVNQTEVA